MKVDLFLAFTPLHLKIISNIPKKNYSILVTLSHNNLNKYIHNYLQTDEFIFILCVMGNSLVLWSCFISIINSSNLKLYMLGITFFLISNLYYIF